MNTSLNFRAWGFQPDRNLKQILELENLSIHSLKLQKMRQ